MSNVRAEVANALHWAVAIPRHRVTADVDDGVVTLHGISLKGLTSGPTPKRSSVTCPA